MTQLKGITRRDFINGVPLSVAAGVAPVSLWSCGARNAEKVQLSEAVYPPAFTGMRGGHEGSFEVAHDLAWGRKTWPRPAAQTDGDYDLVVVGGGVSGLAAAWFYRQRAGADTRVLILDNHDDFGGHAKRNEFVVDGETLIGYGGSQSIESPSAYSVPSKKLFRDLGVETDRFYKYYDKSFAAKHGLQSRLYFDAEHYGENKLVDEPFWYFDEDATPHQIRRRIERLPISEKGRAVLQSMMLDETDYLADRSIEEKIDYLRRTSYGDFLRNDVKASEDVVVLLQRWILALWGVGWDALSALEGARNYMPGSYGLGIEERISGAYNHEEPYIFHFPDGNASIARLLVRKLIPEAVPGDTMEDVVKAGVDYGRLDQEDASSRIRLGSTAVDVRNAGDEEFVDIVYVTGGEVHRVRGRHAVLACYAHMTPFICPEMGEEQKQAIGYAEKVPLVFINVALRNWRALKNARAYRIYAPQAFFHATSLDFPVSMGEYKFSASPDRPVVLTMQYVPTEPGLSAKEQHRAGRQRLYQITYEEFETKIVEQLTGMLGSYGFDAERDIAGVTVNRWPHGYAYEYNELEDDWGWGPEKGPHIVGRTPIGRIVMANSDSQAYAYLDGAIDAAHRAVSELFA